MIVLVATSSILTVGCSKDSEYKKLDFTEIIEIKQPGLNAQSAKKLRVAVAAMVSPKATFIYYRELLDYIGKKLNYKIELVQRKTYGEVNTLFSKREVDLAFICTGPYVSGKEKYGFKAIATPVVLGKPSYQSYLIVHQDSNFQRLEDLRGSSFAFTDPESNTGALLPNYWLSQIDETPKAFFKSVTYTYSHDNSILAVAKKLVDAAAIDSHIWEYYHRNNPFYTSRTRIIKKSEPFGSPPLVVSVYLDGNLQLSLRDIVLSMHSDPEGMLILTKLMIDRFVIPQQKWYEPVRALISNIKYRESSIDAAEKS